MVCPKTISYSGLSDWQYCPLYYKLRNIDKLRSPPNVYTHWGTLVHNYVQAVLKDEIEPSVASKRFIRTWKKFCGIYKEDDFLSIAEVGGLTVLTIKERFAEEFGEYEVVETEMRIEMPNGTEWPQKFKGFVDIVIKLSDGSYIVADFKTCKSTWSFNHFKDKYKDYQLTLYKHFLCQDEKLNLPLDKTDTYFITLERDPKSKNPTSFTRVTSANKKVANALKWLSNALNSINKEKWLKNRASCLKYGANHPCDFYKSENCS